MEMRYVVEFRDASGSYEKPLISFDTTRAPYAFSVGDFVNPSGWGGENPVGSDEHYQIISIEHQLSLADTTEGQQGQHNVVITIKAVQKSRSRQRRVRPSHKSKRSRR